MGLMQMVVLADRKEGLWNRTLLTGVKMKHLLFSHVVFVTSIVSLMNIEIALIGYSFDILSWEKSLVYFAILEFTSLIGLPIGLMFGIVFDRLRTFSMFLMTMTNIMTQISGTFEINF